MGRCGRTLAVQAGRWAGDGRGGGSKWRWCHACSQCGCMGVHLGIAKRGRQEACLTCLATLQKAKAADPCVTCQNQGTQTVSKLPLRH